ncbi:GNAT family N-acetyltransferase [Kitasatospora sp. NPDC058201]|uniref:GNAT family N-acetyltransferase n=1 Tax=Streptomycetaceae TaxID=2062 RepID=UPI002E7A9B18|nr:GNAT family N-acetyltransferase [Streptomyces sp. BE303]MED7953097.1 GNAT family N-acetyltransferase [Streptomyces sp. BE303]
MGIDAHGGTRDPGSRPEEQTDTIGGIEIRSIAEDEIEPWDRALVVGFLRPHVGSAADYRRRQWQPGRMLTAVDAGRFVATYRSFDTELTVPGGAVVTANALTAVTVTATHRRRGLLSGMMARDLAAARERGAAVAILIAAEYNIYGRFGFGPATRGHGWNIDLQRAGGLRAGLPTVPGGRIDLVTMAELRKLGPELHDRWRLTQPGAIARDEVMWKRYTGEIEVPGFDWKEPFAAVHRDAEGTATGLAVYKIDDAWDGSYPNCTLTVLDLFALDRGAGAELWRYLVSVDWVRKVVVENIGPDDPLPLLLNDPRAATPYADNADFMWLRVLDVEAAFNARTYGAPGRVVLEVEDRDGYAAGRWAIDVGADGTGRCSRTADEADLAMDASVLGSLYLSGETVPRLAAAGLVTELRPRAAADADLLLRTPLLAWNLDGF